MAFSPGSAWVQLPSSEKDAMDIGLGATQIQFGFMLTNHNLKDAISREGHMHRDWDLNLSFVGTQAQFNP